VQRLKTKVGNLLVPGNNDPWLEVRGTLNRSLFGWSNYFCYRTRRSAFRGVDRYVYERVRDFLARRHKVAGRGTHRFSLEVVYGELGVDDFAQGESALMGQFIGTKERASADACRAIDRWRERQRATGRAFARKVARRAAGERSRRSPTVPPIRKS
jgi:hypothetical protein